MKHVGSQVIIGHATDRNCWESDSLTLQSDIIHERFKLLVHVDVYYRHSHHRVFMARGCGRLHRATPLDAIGTKGGPRTSQGGGLAEQACPRIKAPLSGFLALLNLGRNKESVCKEAPSAPILPYSFASFSCCAEPLQGIRVQDMHSRAWGGGGGCFEVLKEGTVLYHRL